MVKQYQHTQIGYLTIVILSVAFLFILRLMKMNRFNWIGLVVLVILGFCFVLFVALTVIIKDDFLEIRHWVYKKRFSLKEIASTKIVKNPWYYGWGIRLTPYGWLYNVSGFYAVEITMKNGKSYRIGTDNPNELEQAIRQSIE